MSEKINLWVFCAPRDREFAEMLANKMRADIHNITVRTSDSLEGYPGEPRWAADINPVDIVLVILSESVLGGWFVDYTVDAVNRTKNLLILLRMANVNVPALLTGYEHYDFSDETRFDQTYKQLLRRIQLILNDRETT